MSAPAPPTIPWRGSVAGACLRRGRALRGGLVDDLLQLREQVVERLGVLFHRRESLRLILVAGIRGSGQLLLRGTLLRQLFRLFLALHAGRLQRLLFGRDRCFQLLQPGQLAHQLLHPLQPIALEILRIHQGAGDARHVLIAQQHAQVRTMAQGIGGAQQIGNRGALAVQRLLQRAALLLQLVELLLLGGQLGVGLAYRFRRCGQRIGLLRQLGIDAVAFGRGIGLLAGQCLHLVAQIRQLLFCLTLFGPAFPFLLGMNRRGNQCAQPEDDEQCTGKMAGATRAIGHRPIIAEPGARSERSRAVLDFLPLHPLSGDPWLAWVSSPAR